MRRAKHGQAADFATVHQLSHDEAGLNSLADADVVGDQQAHGAEAQGHQQRYQLIGTWLHGNVAERTEWATART